MKELSIEEKAKVYDSIFERLKKMYNNNKTNIVHRLIYERYFPELVESEDEKIRKSIIKLLQVGGYMSPEDKDKAFAWLKGHDGKKWIYEDVYLKEKEQVFQDGIDEVLENPQKYGLEKQEKDNMGISEVTRKELEDNLNKALEKETPESWNKFLDEQGEQKEQEMQDGLKSDNTVFQKFYEKGKADMKEQMMKDAIPARVSFGQIVLQERPISTSVAKDGDKVKIIIVKEEEK